MKVDPLAQLVEHNTFNVGVLGSSPKRITKKDVSTTSFFDTSWALTQADSSFLECYRHHHLKSDIAPHIIDTTTTRYGV